MCVCVHIVISLYNLNIIDKKKKKKKKKKKHTMHNRIENYTIAKASCLLKFINYGYIYVV